MYTSKHKINNQLSPILSLIRTFLEISFRNATTVERMNVNNNCRLLERKKSLTIFLATTTGSVKRMPPPPPTENRGRADRVG